MDRSNIDKIKITDNILFTSVFENKDIIKKFLEIILNFKIIEVDFIQKEKVIDSIGKSRGVRLDIYVKDTLNNIYNVEIQTSDEYNLLKRLRYYQSRIDADNLNKGDDFNNLKTTYIIFICSFNPFIRLGLDDCIYKIEPYIQCNNNTVQLNDGSHKIVINTKYDISKIKNKELKSFIELMEDGYISNTNGILSDMIVKEMNRLKKDEEWSGNYMTVMQEYAQEYAKEYAQKYAKEVVVELLKSKVDDNIILNCTRISSNELEQIKKEISLE